MNTRVCGCIFNPIASLRNSPVSLPLRYTTLPKRMIDLFWEYLFQSLSLVESEYPNCGILVTGDFNRLDISGLLGHFRLKQIVKVPTCKDATLDLILTNMHEHYSAPQAFPFGLSDHDTVMATALHGKHNNNSKKTITKWDLRASSKAAMGRYLNLFDWQLLFAPPDKLRGDMEYIFRGSLYWSRHPNAREGVPHLHS